VLQKWVTLCHIGKKNPKTKKQKPCQQGSFLHAIKWSGINGKEGHRARNQNVAILKYYRSIIKHSFLFWVQLIVTDMQITGSYCSIKYGLRNYFVKHMIVKYFIFLFVCLVEWGFEFRGLHLQSRCSTTWATPSVHFADYFGDGSRELFAQTGL
jgi:hypothetical protein